MTAKRLSWAAWTALAIAWVALAAYAVGHRERPLCGPADRHVVLRLSQPGGTTEAGVVYLNYEAAKAARDGITVWLRQYNKCP